MCLFLFLLLPQPLPALETGSLADAAVGRALHRSRAWQVLLHYRLRGGEVTSLVDDPRFFLSPAGKRDPESELRALSEGIMEDPSKGDDHVRCRFPARSEWLIGELGLSKESLPSPSCRKLDGFLSDLNPEVAHLVFPSAHNNGPASMFGHTLVRIGREGGSDLLSHAVNYAAHADDTNGLLYAVKGIFGLYPGYYSILPHFEKLKEYGDLEHRDVWEYRLELTRGEVRRMALHVWELQEISSDYFFFDENCSFNLLFLIEAARPSLELAREYWDRVGFWVMPVDTIQVLRKKGVLGGVAYRPSLATRISHAAALLPPETRDWARQTGAGERDAASIDPGLSPRERAIALELAAEYTRYLYSTRAIPLDVYQKRFHGILRERSRLQAVEGMPQPPRPAEPESGHPPGRVTISYGWWKNRRYVEVEGRPAYHDLLDPPDGYTRGAQIGFMTVAGRWYPEEESLKLERVIPVDILSIATRDTFFRPVSWKVRGGVERFPVRDLPRALGGRLETGGGVAWELPGSLTASLFADADLRMSGRLPDGFSIGVGSTVSLTGNPLPRWSVDLSGKIALFALDPHREVSIALAQGVTLSRGWGVRGIFSHSRAYGRTERGGSIGLVHWF